MLQRAASNAYSWWVAGHIRTKQSKWLEQNIQDMEEKVNAVVKLISEEGDSFAKRAEMYYKKRPEIVSFVEESFRAYRALAERYDHISKELQSANNTLASAFPEQFQFIMDEDDDDESPAMPRKGYPNQSSNSKTSAPNVPKHFPTKNIKAIIALASKANGNNNNQSPRKGGRRPGNKAVEALRSGFNKNQAVDEIDKLQKTILTKQTEKEFTKNSYESGVAKYIEIEKEITEMQEKVSTLQEEYGVGKAIEDNEARTLMLEAALKSCQDAFAELQEKQAKADAEAKEERGRIKNAGEKILSLKGKFQISQTEPLNEGGACEQASLDDNVNTTSQAKEVEMLRDKMREHFEGDSSLHVSNMMEKIDELVKKVISLESAVSSQMAMIDRMRVESDELQIHIQSLENDRSNLIDGKNILNDKLKEMEQKLKGLQELDRSVERRNESLQTQFNEASSNLNVISQTLPDLKMDGADEESQAKQEEAVAEKNDGHEKASPPISQQQVEPNNLPAKSQDSVKVQESRDESAPVKVQQEGDTSRKQPEKPMNDSQASEPEMAKQGEDEPNWQKEYASVLQNYNEVKKKLSEVENELQTKSQHSAEVPQESRDESAPMKVQQEEDTIRNQSSEKPMNDSQASKKQGANEPNWQKEYVSILQNYKEVKKKLSEVENKTEDSLAELRGLRNVIDNKDEEIQSLQQKLILLQKKLDEYKNMKETKEENHTCPHEPCQDRSIAEVMIKLMHVEQQREMSPVEAKLRSDVDEILEDNLDFWMRFSAAFSEIQKFQSQVQDLHKDLAKIEEDKVKRDVGSETSPSLRSDSRAIYKHLKEIQAELIVWLEQSMGLKEELQRRFSQLCNIQEEITKALNDGAVHDQMQFTSLQGAKFHGEVLNMQQENNRVADELQSSLDNVTNLQMDIERTISKLNEELGMSGSKSQSSPQHQNPPRNQIPLHSFIFGVKPKKQRTSLFSCIQPHFHKKHHHLK